MIRFRSIISRIVAFHVVAIGVTSVLMPLALYYLLNGAANSLHRDALRSQAFTIGSFSRAVAPRVKTTFAYGLNPASAPRKTFAAPPFFFTAIGSAVT